MDTLWRASDDVRKKSQLSRFRRYLKEQYGLQFGEYRQLWQWSVEHLSEFWSILLEYFEVDYSGTYSEVLKGSMPGARWFEGIELNYAEHLFRRKEDVDIALFWRGERGPQRQLSWGEVKQKTAAVQALLRDAGVGTGDRVAAYLPNVPEASIAFFATAAMGAVWSSCSPDFGTFSVVERFSQIQPKVLFACDGYTYNGKEYNRTEEVLHIVQQIPSIQLVVWVPYLGVDLPRPDSRFVDWEHQVEARGVEVVQFVRVPFAHPLWVLYSSGTTGKPKAITHGHGGVLLEHFKYMAFHNDVHPGENFFWYSTTGWMMWNFVHASALMGARIVLYEGSAAYPDMYRLWQYAEELPIHHFGTSAPYLMACRKRGVRPRDRYALRHLRSIGSTGAPLPPEGFDYVYEEVHPDVWLCSMSGGTDVCTAFVGGCIERPVYRGEIQCRALGCDLDAWDAEGNSLVGKVGEMVIKQPMPSMPIYFWNDPDMRRYRESYFSMYPGVWRHGDWIEITPRDGVIIYGRSDATLNRHGVRIGTAEIYKVVESLPEIIDSLIVNLELPDGNHYMPLYVVTDEDKTLTDELRQRIKERLREQYSPRHVPDEIIQAPGIPTTISGKKMEAPVKRLFLGMDRERAINIGAMKNPEVMPFYEAEARRIQERFFSEPSAKPTQS